jgi:hypothetical protein
MRFNRLSNIKSPAIAFPRLSVLGFAMLLVILLCISCDTPKVEAEQNPDNDNKLEVLLLGTFHFANYNADHNLDVTQIGQVDVFTPHNQLELERIADNIVKFRPDKIFVEYPFSRQRKLDSLFSSFNNEDFANQKRNEIVQLAFRTGKKLGASRLYAFDYNNAAFPYDSMIKSMEDAGQHSLIEKNNHELEAYEYRYNSLVDSTKSIIEVLRFLNSKDNLSEDLGWYLNYANRAGTLNDTVGTFLASEWYRRNLMMHSIIQKTIEPQDQRIMVLAGASHIGILKQFMELNSDLEVKETLKVIEGHI